MLRRLRRRKARGEVARTPTAPVTLPPGHFEVLCRIDAYADYIAVVEAESAEEAAERASDDHAAFNWQHRGVCEFDDHYYVTLDKDGWELEGTEVGDR